MNPTQWLTGFELVNRIPECSDGNDQPLWPEKTHAVIVHRTIWEPRTAVGVCKRFQSHGPVDGLSGLASYTGGESPYHVIIEGTGRAVQCLPLSERGCGARRWNSSALQVAVMHPTHKEPLPHPMGIALVQVLRYLCLHVGGVKGHLLGHSEARGASADPLKQCPGSGVDMHALRSLLTEQLAPWWHMAGTVEADKLLIAAGFDL